MGIFRRKARAEMWGFHDDGTGDGYLAFFTGVPGEEPIHLCRNISHLGREIDKLCGHSVDLSDQSVDR